jgi:hypothetical protein
MPTRKPSHFIGFTALSPKRSTAMHSGVAYGTKRDQVLLRIIARVTAKFLVVNLKIGHCATRLASPAVAMQHLLAQTVVLVGVELHAHMFWSDSSHDAFSVTWCKNACLSSPGRNLKNRKADCKRTSGFSFSRFAPAKKSAQIISKQ